MKPYQERFVKEYNELHDRTVKLDNMLKKYKNGELDFEPDCPYELLYTQLIYMVNYLCVLEERAKIENIKL